MNRAVGIGARVVVGAAVLAVVVWRLGGGPFRAGLQSVTVGAALLAFVLTAAATGCAAWRWRRVARGLGVGVSWPGALVAYYRSQFLNSVLPGGVLGDVHRGVRHGQDVQDVGRGLRAVGWERTAGQLVQAGLAVIVLLVLPSPVRAALPLVLVGAVVGVGALALVARARPSGRDTRWARAVRAARADVRTGLLDRSAWPGIVLASCGVVAGHIAVFVIAARVSGADASVERLIPLAMLVLLATSVPTNIGGWGPREGAAAWAFGAAGLGADAGVAAAAAYGVLAFVATLPGAVVLLVSARRQNPAEDQDSTRAPIAAELEGASRG